jgi:hypothetical protein
VNAAVNPPRSPTLNLRGNAGFRQILFADVEISGKPS